MKDLVWLVLRFMDALEELSDGSISSGESAPECTHPKKKKKEVSLEHLQKCGYKGGASVLLVPEPEQETQQELQW